MTIFTGIILLVITFFLYWIGENIKRATASLYEIKEILEDNKKMK